MAVLPDDTVGLHAKGTPATQLADGRATTEGKGSSTASGQAFQWSVHSYINEYIRYADTKAALVIAYASAMIGVLYARGLHKTFTEHAIGTWSLRVYLSAGAFSLLAVSILLAACSVAPRLSTHGDRGFVFWDDIRRHDSPDSYNGALCSLSSEDLTSQLSTHIFSLSGIAKNKFRLVGFSSWTALIGSAVAGFLLVFCV